MKDAGIYLVACMPLLLVGVWVGYVWGWTRGYGEACRVYKNSINDMVDSARKGCDGPHL